MKSTFKFLCAMLIAIFCGQQVRAQLSGTISIPNATYPTLDSVIKALNLQGVGTGGVTINVTAAQNAPVGGYQLGSTTLNASTSALKPITINGNGNTVTSNVGTGTADGMFTLVGVDYVTINALNLTDTNTASTNAQMEWGYGLVKLNSAAPFDGCQYNTISGCTIILNRNNAASPTAASWGGSKGVMFANWVLSAPSTQLSITATTDAHNNNTVKGCTIKNVNMGVYMYGYNASSPYTLYDQNNTIGGYGGTDGNNISNYGGAAYEAAGIYVYQYEANLLIRGNTINNIANGGVAGANTLDGIYMGSSSAANITIRSNNVTLTQGLVTSTMQGIISYCGASGTTNTINVDSNVLNITSNGSSHTTYAYYLPSSAAANILNFNANQLSVTSASTGTLYSFYLALPSVGTNPVWNVNDNKYVSLTRTASGSTYGFYQTGSILGGTVYNQMRNKINNISYTPAASNTGSFYSNYVYGGTGTYAVRNISYDTVSNVSIGTGTFYGFYTYNYATGSTINNNLFTNITSAGSQYHLYLSSSSFTGTSVYKNTVSNTVNNATGSVTYGLYLSGATSIDIYNNTITNMQTAITTSSAIYGMYFSSGTLVNVYNNMVSDIRCPAGSSTSPIYGMYISSGTNFNLYHNTINLGVSSALTGGTDFGATGIYYGSGVTSLDLRNNIVRVNATAAGVGFVAALRRSAGTTGVAPTNLANTSTGNIYYAPNASNSYLYAEGTSNPLTNAYNLTNDASFNTSCGQYKTFMVPRESSSFTENNLTQIGTTPTFSPSGTSFAKSVGVVTTAPAVTTDFNGTTRTSPPDAGALQFTGTAIDASAPSISYSLLPSTTYCLTGPTLTATITDISGVNTTTNAPRIYYKRKVEVDSFGTYPAANVSAFNGWKYVTATNSGSTFTFVLDYTKLTAAPAPGDTIQYFVVAQDNNTTPNVGSSVVAYKSGFCPADVNLSVLAGPTSSVVTKNSYAILTQPALPTVTPATANVCQGSSVKLTAVPISGALMATLGTGTVVNTTSGYPTPYGQYYGSNHEQYLILASELTAQGLTAGNMTSLAFNLNAGYTYNALQNYAVQMANTSVASLTSSLITTGFTSVYTNTSYSPPTAAGWATVTFSTPFVWDGVSNVVVDVSFSNCSVCNGTSSCTTSYTNNGVVNQTSTSFTSTLNFHADNNCTINSMAPSISGTTYNQRPNMQLNGTQKFNVNWSNITNLYKDSAMTQPMGATDTNTVVYAAPTGTTASYAVKNVLTPCTSAAGAASTVSVLPAPTATVSPAGTASFCGGSSATLTGSAASGMTYQWLLGGSAVSGATASAYTASTTGTYTFKVTNATTGCSATSAPVVVSNTAPPAATATASGATTVCNGTVVTVNANTGTGLTYQWLKNGTAISGATGASYGAATSGNYAVMVYNAGNCFTTSSAVPVTVNTINTAVSASGSTALCTGSTVTFSVTAAASQVYQWRLNGTAISGATNSSYTAGTAGAYSVKIVNSSYSCTDSSAPISVTVGTGPVSAFTPTGTVGMCPGNTTVLSYTPVTGVSYQWQLNGNNIAGATNTTYTAAAGGNYTLLASTSPTCQTTSAVTSVVVNPAPNVVTTPSGNATVCQNSTITMTVPTGSNYSYQWKSGGVNIAGASNNTYTTSAPGNYTVRVINNLTGCKDTSANIAVTQVAIPAATATATGPLTICAGDTTRLAANSGTGLSYQWQIGGSTIAGATDSIYRATQAGSYTVNVTNTGGCSATSSSLTVNVNPVPVSTITYNSPLVFCQGGGVVLTALSAVGQNYQWLQNGTPIAGAVNAYYVASASGTYQIKVTSALGCSAVSQTIPVTVNPLPSPVITRNGFTLSTGSFTSYQWYLNNTALTNGHSQTLNATQNGGYHVVVTDANGCSNSSTVIFINNVGVSSITAAGDVKIFPNPTTGVVNIDAPVKVNVSVRDLSGKEVLYAPNAQKIDITSVASGVYMLMISDTEGHLVKVEKVFKTE